MVVTVIALVFQAILGIVFAVSQIRSQHGDVYRSIAIIHFTALMGLFLLPIMGSSWSDHPIDALLMVGCAFLQLVSVIAMLAGLANYFIEKITTSVAEKVQRQELDRTSLP